MIVYYISIEIFLYYLNLFVIVLILYMIKNFIGLLLCIEIIALINYLLIGYRITNHRMITRSLVIFFLSLRL